MEKIDLHIHSSLSDGSLSPESVVNYAIEKGCQKISITDHDLVTDFSDLSQKYDIPIIAGIEINSSYRNMHFLGYGMENIKLINSVMLDLRMKNEKICFEVVRMMYDDGFDISVDKIREFIKSNGCNCSILDKRKIVKYLIYKKYVSNVVDAYHKLIGFNKKYYVPNHKLTPTETIKLIHQSNGIVFLAHPSTLTLDCRDLYNIVLELKDNGLDGIEIANSKITPEQSLEYAKIADRVGLLKSVGSDFHNPENDYIGVLTENDIYKKIDEKISLIRKR